MFKFICVTLALMIVIVATVADDTADIVEMAYDAIDTVDNDLGDDETDETLGYRYGEGALEDNINVAVKAAILDQYGQAVANEVAKKKLKALEEKKLSEKNPKNSKTSKPGSSKTSRDKAALNKPGKSVSKTAAKTTAGGLAAAEATRGASGEAVREANAVKPVQSPNYDDSDTITHFVSKINADGTYGFDFKQSSGLEFREMGQGGQYAEGSYQYISPEGEHISVTYTADENGFHPESDSIPTPPPVPAYILKALDYIRDHPTAEELADREVRAKQI